MGTHTEAKVGQSQNKNTDFIIMSSYINSYEEVINIKAERR